LKVLITGITGLSGSYLAELLVEKGHEIFGIDINEDTSNLENIVNRIKFERCDIKQKKIVAKILERIKPDYIFHLAGIMEGSPLNIYQTNVVGTMHILEAVRNIDINPLILVTGSSAEYGLVHPHENPITERNTFRPITPYGVSKIAQDMLSFQYFKSYELRIIRARTFNNTAPREKPTFVCSTIAKQIAEIEKGLREPIVYVGNTKSVRDFIDTRDVVKGYYLMTKKARVGEVYNVCSGKGYSIQNILDMLLNMSKAKIKVKHRKDQMRRDEVPVQIGECSKLRKATGWTPKIEIEKTLHDLLTYWRENLEKVNS